MIIGRSFFHRGCTSLNSAKLSEPDTRVVRFILCYTLVHNLPQNLGVAGLVKAKKNVG